MIAGGIVMAFSVWDARRGTWSVRWNNGKKLESETVTHRPPRGWKPGDPKPKEPTVVVEVKAAKMKLEKAARTRRPIGDEMTVREFLDARREFCKSRGSKNSEEAFRLVFDHFSAWCERNKCEYIDQVTSKLCSRWFEERSREISPKTKRPRSYSALIRDKSLLSAAWNREIKLGVLDKNPWTPVEVSAKPPESKRESWSPDQLEELLRHSKRWLKDLLIVGCHTGIRISALLMLEWSDIEFSKPGEPGRGTVNVRKELDKAGKGYSVPMSKLCFETLARMHRHRDKNEVRVIRGMRGKPITKAETTGIGIRRACLRAKLPKPSSPNHHMRRTFGRQAVLGQLTGRPVPIYVVSRWLGHSSVKMTEHYLDLKIDASHHWMEEQEKKKEEGGDKKADDS